MKHSRLSWAGLAVALIFGTATGFSIRGGNIGTARALAMDTPATLPAQAPAPVRIAPPDFSAIVQQYGPAVVDVSVTGTVNNQAQVEQSPSPFGKLDPNDPFFDFFKHFQIPQGEAPMHGLGSGFIVKSDGYILTNAHVVANANEVTAKLTDGRQFKAFVPVELG